MIKWNTDKHIFEHQHSEFYHCELKDVDQPNLYKTIFPYDEVSRIDFDDRIMPIQPAEDIFITDTTFRDGQQSRPPFTVEQIVNLWKMLHKLSGKSGIIRQSEFFLYTDKDREALEKCIEMDFRYPEITGWVRAKKEDISLVKDTGLRETGILTSVSDYHIFLKLGLTRKKALDAYLGIVKSILDAGIVPRCHFEDVTRSDIYGFSIPFAIELMKLREESGIDIKIRLCDTLGNGISYPQAALPRSVPRLVRAFISDAGVPGHLLEWHGHNDFHKAHINSATAWLYGCSGANATLLGLGERTGNAPIEGLIMEYIGLRGNDEAEIDTTVITEIADYCRTEIGIKIPDNMPFIGSDFNVTRAGVHVDGLLKNEEIYNIFDTKKLLNRPILIEITDKSGKAGIAHWINIRLGLKGDASISKRHPGISKIYKWVTSEYETGRVTSISHEEMEKKVKKFLPELFMSDMEKIKHNASQAAMRVVEETVENPAMKTMRPDLQEPVMQKVIDENPSIQWAYVVDVNGIKTTRNITGIADKARYENFGVGTDYSDREWYYGPLQSGKTHVSNFYISRMTGALCITVSGPIIDENDDIAGIFGVDIKFEDWASRVEDIEDIAEATRLALKTEYEAKKRKKDDI